MKKSATLLAPFPYFGGKQRVAADVWQRFGNVPNYVEPFAGSLAVLLARPTPAQTETVNDRDGLLSNFWRAVKADPGGVAAAADWPVMENDLHARHAWLVGHRESLTARLEGDPAFYDVQAAGWWVWGACAWIGSGWCSGQGPWMVEDARLVRSGSDQGIKRQLSHVGDSGQGIHRKLPHVGDSGRGINRQHTTGQHIRSYFQALADRLRSVRVCSGDWTRVVGPSVTYRHGLTGVFLDPPYDGHEAMYTGATSVAAAVRDWAIAHGDHADMRIALCGYDDFVMPSGWECLRWKANGGYGSQGNGAGRINAARECVWFSPACVPMTVPWFAESMS